MRVHSKLGVVLSCVCVLGLSSAAQAQTFFYTGPNGGDFFNETNWNSLADGTGVNPAGDPLIDSTSNAITLDLIIDGDTVTANGQVDFGTGSLTLQSGSQLDVTGADNDFDINSNSTFSLTNATLNVDDVVNFEGDLTFVGGAVNALTDDIAFQDTITSMSIDGTTFTAGDNVFFDGFAGTVTNATFDSADRLGLRNNVAVVMSDTDVTVESGTGDIDDVFAAAALGSSLTLNGASTLLADSVEEGATLTLGGTTTATMGGQGARIVADGSTITLASLNAVLNVGALDSGDIDFVDARTFLFNDFTGLSYAADPSTWNVTNWNGTDAVSLQLVSEVTIPTPGSAALAITAAAAAFAARRRRA